MAELFSELDKLIQEGQQGLFVLRSSLAEGEVLDLESWKHPREGLKILSATLGTPLEASHLPGQPLGQVHDHGHGQQVSPLGPFANWLQQGWQALDPTQQENCWSAAAFHGLHARAIKDWLQGAQPQRWDESKIHRNHW